MELDNFFGRPVGEPTIDGVFITSSVKLVVQALRYFIKKGVVDTTKWFCDAGCGDGRIVALTAAEFQIPSLGVESDPKVYQKAEEHLFELLTLVDQLLLIKQTWSWSHQAHVPPQYIPQLRQFIEFGFT